MEIQYDKIALFRDNMSSLRETSKDSDSPNPECMTNSEIAVVNFDKVKESYIKDMKLSFTPCSNDALYIDKNGDLYFIEFKNGIMTRPMIFNVYNKIYDSLLIFNDIVGQNISFCRKHVNFILVYNESKNLSEDYNNEGKNLSKDGKIKNQDCSKAKIGKYFYSKAKKKYIRFGLERFEKLYFQEVFTYTQQEFEDSFLSSS